MKVVIALSILALALASPYDLMASANFTYAVHNFTDGLGDGLKNPDKVTACYNSSALFLDSISNVTIDIDNIVNGDFEGIVKLILDSKPTITSGKEIVKECNFTALYDQVKEFFGPKGMDIIKDRVMWNIGSLYGDLDKLKSGDPYKMGEGVGNAFRLVSDWSL
jgi:hypothetical protein